jgi:hypothetical protein
MLGARGIYNIHVHVCVLVPIDIYPGKQNFSSFSDVKRRGKGFIYTRAHHT